MRETAEACKIIFALTHFQIRLLSKSALLPELVQLIPEEFHQRLILGVSTGTLDENLSKAIEGGTAPVRKRLESLHWLQDNGFRTFGMICPIMPQVDYAKFAREAAEAIRFERCEHVWAEAINSRGKSFTNTLQALVTGNFMDEATAFKKIAFNPREWEKYSRETFEALADVIPPEKFRYLQYVDSDSVVYWEGQRPRGALRLGKFYENLEHERSLENTVAPEGEAVELTEIRELHLEIKNLLRSPVDKASVLGEKLAALKKAGGHGKWAALVKKLGMSSRSASNYLAVWQYREVIQAKSAIVADFTLTDALREVAKIKREKRLALKPAKASSVVVAKEIVEKPQDAPARAIPDQNHLPIVLFQGSEALLAKLLDTAKNQDEPYEHQVVRAGETKLNAFFIEQLGIEAEANLEIAADGA